MPESTEPAPKKKAGAFDIRVVIALLLAIYGAVLAALGLFQSDAELAKSDGLNINLWGGLAMLLAAALFVVWARLRPIAVPAEPPAEDADSTG